MERGAVRFFYDLSLPQLSSVRFICLRNPGPATLCAAANHLKRNEQKRESFIVIDLMNLF